MITGVNSKSSLKLFRESVHSPYYVDKSLLLSVLSSRIGTREKYICVTRPRRFGKTSAAEMIAAFYLKDLDPSDLFDSLAVSNDPKAMKHFQKYNVITMDMSRFPKECDCYEIYIDFIVSCLQKELEAKFLKFEPKEELWDYLNRLSDETSEGGNEDDTSFIFVIDEWDAVLHEEFMREGDKRSYLAFLSALLKGQPYVTLAYMTGVLPIAKYTSGSALNMFEEYNVASSPLFCEYFGFSDAEVDELFERYLNNCANVTSPIIPSFSRDELRDWYDGYSGYGSTSIYNPRSIVSALQNNLVSSYWTNTGPFDEVSNTIQENVDAIREDIVHLVAGERIKTKVREFSATSASSTTKEELFSRMVVFGFLTSLTAVEPNATVEVWIPNKELLLQFQEALNRKEMGYVYHLAQESSRLLKATLQRDSETIVSILKSAHDQEIPLLRYNNEGDLGALISLMYLSARDTYEMRREDKAGGGFADITFVPKNSTQTGFIVELKKDATPKAAISQIRKRGYLARFGPDIAGIMRTTGEVLAVGITYNSKTKTHSCKIEVLRESVKS